MFEAGHEGDKVEASRGGVDRFVEPDAMDWRLFEIHGTATVVELYRLLVQAL
jgi:hypothetical protein